MPGDRGVVTVVVTTHDSARTLESCLQSIRGQSHPGVELVVVDNRSNDDTTAIAARHADHVASWGPERSAQRNHGARIGTGSRLLFIDSDMLLDRAVVDDALAAMERTGMPAAIIPESSFGEGFWSRCRALERSCYLGDDDVEAARAYTRDAFEEAGGFDEQVTGGEDWDLSQRVAQGRRLPRCAAVIRHDEGRVTLRSAWAKRRYYAPGYIEYARRRGCGRVLRVNPLTRAAYLRHWRRLVRHPLLAVGMFLLKVVEVGAVVASAAGGLVRAKLRPAKEHL